MAVQLHHYPSSENRSDRVRAGMECGVDQRGFLVHPGVFMGKNAFQVPSMAGSNQYHLFNQLTSGGRQGYATQQQLDAAALLNVVTEKEQIHAANVMMGSGSRKRTRDRQAVDEYNCGVWSNVATPQPQQFLINGVTQLDTQHGSVVNPHSNATNGVSTGLRLASFERSASPVSTSGRSVDPAGAKPTWPENFASHLQQERDEVAQLLKIQNEQLQSFIEEKRQRHARQVIAAAEEGFQRQMREKDAEMERVRRQNQDLIERSAQLNAENQHWQSKARSTEVMVSVLRSNLAQAQEQNAAAATPALVLGQQQHKHCLEGCGDSDGAGAGAADDCASSYVDDVNDAHTRARNENRELREQRTCRVCRCNDVSMLLLPCRHLCLCHECEGQLAACPLCRTLKNASVQVYMS